MLTLWRLFLLATALLVPAAHAAGACSPFIGAATLNEYNHLDDFVEVKRLNTGISLSGWKVRLYSSAGSYVLKNFPPPSTDVCGEYYVFSYASNQTPFDADIVLLDQNDDVVDILRTRTSLPVGSAFYTPYPSCGFISPPTDVQIDPGRKGVDRTPDGVGAWRVTPGTGSGSYTSRCGGNTPGGTSADLRITKTVSVGTIALGGSVSFTVTVTNLGPTVASTLVINDLLPAGLSYVSHTVSAGTYSAVTGLWTLSTLAVNGSQTLTLVATGASAGTFTNTATASSDNTDPNTANNSASATVAVAASAGTFNAVDVGANALTGMIKTKIAGNAFSLDVYALNSSGTAVDTAFGGAVQIQLLGNTSLGVTLDANNCPVTSTGLNAQGVTLASGKATITVPAVSDAWRDVRVRITYSGSSPVVTRCSRDNFAIRPASFAGVAVTDTDWITAGVARTLDNTAAAGGVVHKAGRPLRLSATAVNAAGGTTSNYVDRPAATPILCLLPTGCSNANLGSFTLAANAVAGVLADNAASYSEAGSFTLQLRDSSFAAVDASDGSTAAERDIVSAAINVGRFVPDHFDLTPNNTPLLKTFNDATCGSRSFTYIGQPFGYVTAPQSLVTARNAAGATTVNYANDLWKLAAAGVTQTYSSAPATPALTATLGAPIITSNNDGTGFITANGGDMLSYARVAAAPFPAPFNANIALAMSVQDSAENAASQGIIATSTPAAFNGGGTGIAFDAGNAFRYGRLRLSNAHGSERLALNVPVRAEYFNGSLFVANSADSCTRFTLASDLALGNYQRNLAPGETTPSPASMTLSGGAAAISLTAPGAGNSGSVDLTLTVPAWLQFNWSGALGNPKGRATFGVYNNANEFIYLRESY